MFLSLALTSLLTGVTEPIEFTFIFLAPLLYVLHALLTGLAMVLMDLLGVRLGFSFSAGLFDYPINFGASSRPLLLLPVGALYSAIYYFTFSYCIRRFNLNTPGRDAEPAVESAARLSRNARAEALIAALRRLAGRARRRRQCRRVEPRISRLCVTVRLASAVDRARLHRLGLRGAALASPTSVHLLTGVDAAPLADALRALLAGARD